MNSMIYQALLALTNENGEAKLEEHLKNYHFITRDAYRAMRIAFYEVVKQNPELRRTTARSWTFEPSWPMVKEFGPQYPPDFNIPN